MCMVAGILGGGALGAVGSVIAGNEQASGQKQAANTQQGMFNTIVGQEQPFLNAGYGATTALNQLLGLAPGNVGGLDNGYLLKPFSMTQDQLEQYPGYQFAKNIGEQSVRNSMSPTVGAYSGPALKSLLSFNQGLATQTYQNAFNNWQTNQTNIFNRLNQLMGLGQNAAGNLGNAGTSLGTGIAEAQAARAGSIAGGISGAAGDIGSSLPLYAFMAGGRGGGGNPFWTPTDQNVIAAGGY